MSLTRYEIEEYLIVKEELRVAKAKELKMRNSIMSNFRFSEMEGVQNREFEDETGSIKLKIGLKLTRSVDQDAIDSLWQDFSVAEREAVERKYSLITKDYKELVENDEAKTLMQAITEKPAQASLSITIDDI